MEIIKEEANTMMIVEETKQENDHEKRINNFEKMFENPEEDPNLFKNQENFRIQINTKDVPNIRKLCVEKKILLIDEYDYKIATEKCPQVKINLKYTTNLRDY